MEQLEKELQESWEAWSKEIDAPWEDQDFDPDGIDVWCDFAEGVALTKDGFCLYCGRKDHRPTKD